MLFLAHGGCRTPTGGSGDYTELTLTQEECIEYCASTPACVAVETKPDDRCEVCRCPRRAARRPADNPHRAAPPTLRAPSSFFPKRQPTNSAAVELSISYGMDEEPPSKAGWVDGAGDVAPVGGSPPPPPPAPPGLYPPRFEDEPLMKRHSSWVSAHV